MKLLAQEIEDADPDLIGLQEVAIWRRGQRGAADGSTTPSTEVVYDYLELLQDELKRRGLNYKVASLQQEADIEAPISISGDDAAEFDVRLTMQDVILAKKGVKTSNEQSENYTAALNGLPIQGTAPVDVVRGYNAVNVNFKQSKKKKQKFQFVNTHLESFVAATRNSQATELVCGDGTAQPEPAGHPARRPQLGSGGSAAGLDRVQHDRRRPSTTRMAASTTSASRRTRAAGPRRCSMTRRPRSTSRIDHVLGRGGGLGGRLGADRRRPGAAHRHRPVADRPRRRRRDPQGRLAT